MDTHLRCVAMETVEPAMYLSTKAHLDAVVALNDVLRDNDVWLQEQERPDTLRSIGSQDLQFPSNVTSTNVTGSCFCPCSSDKDDPAFISSSCAQCAYDDLDEDNSNATTIVPAGTWRGAAASHRRGRLRLVQDAVRDSAYRVRAMRIGAVWLFVFVSWHGGLSVSHCTPHHVSPLLCSSAHTPRARTQGCAFLWKPDGSRSDISTTDALVALRASGQLGLANAAAVTDNTKSLREDLRHIGECQTVRAG